MIRLIKTCGILVFLVTFFMSNQCLAVDWVFFTNSNGGVYYDCNNWTSVEWDPNDCDIPYTAPDWSAADKAIVGSWWEGGSDKGHLIVDYNLFCGGMSIGLALRGYGIMDVYPDANIQTSGIITSEAPDAWSVINVYGGVIHNPPTVTPGLPGWSQLASSGKCYWNQYDGEVLLFMNDWAGTVSTSRLYINVSGGLFKAVYHPIARQGKVYINVSGTGTVQIDDWRGGFLDRGETFFTLNGGGTLIARDTDHEWIADPTLEGALTSDSNIIVEPYGDPNNYIYVKITTDACGAISEADIDMDCDVDFADYASFADNW